MKIIIDTDTLSDNVTGISAGSADANFPASNLRDDFTTNLWKAVSGITTTTLTLSVSKGSAVEILNTNATHVSVVVGTGGDYVLEGSYSLETGYGLEQNTNLFFASSLPGAAGRLWIEFPEYSVAFTVVVTLTAASTVYAGIVRAGKVQSFADPDYGMAEDSKDYSIEKELNNGADYYRKRNVVRQFTGLNIVDTWENAYKLKHNIFDAVGPAPLAIYLVNALNNENLILFAKRINPPKLSYQWDDYMHISLDLKEVI